MAFDDLPSSASILAQVPAGGESAYAGLDLPGPEDNLPEIDVESARFAEMVKKDFDFARNGKLTVQTIMERSLRNYKGEYTEDELNRIGAGRSKVFVKKTRSKVAAACTMIDTVMLGPDGYPLTIAPTEDPNMSDANMSLLNDARGQALDMLKKQYPDNTDLHQQFMQDTDYEQQALDVKNAATAAADCMQNEIDDQLTEMHWDQRFVRGRLDFVIFGTMIFQGPTAAPKRPRRWIRKSVTEWALEEVDPETDLRPDVRHIRPFDFYPDPAADSIEDCNFVIVRHVMNRAQMRGLRNWDGFSTQAVDAVLYLNQEQGNWVPETWEMPVEALADKNNLSAKTSRFVVYEWWGWLSGYQLKKYGMTDIKNSELEQNVLACIWSCGNHTLKVWKSNATPARIPFFVVPYEVIPHSLWGRGVPTMMEDSQAVYNASTRAMIDNMAYTAGPQVVVDMNRICDNVDVTTIHPMKVWTVDNMDGPNAIQPVYFFQPQSNIVQMKAIQDVFRLHMQEETSLPDSIGGLATEGNQVHNRSSEGLSQQQGAALAFIRSVIGNIDKWLTQPMGEALYHWNMQYSSKQHLKGDFDVKATGVVSSMAKEILSNRLNMIQSNLATPAWADRVNLDKLVEMQIKNMNLEDTGIIKTERQYKKDQEEKQKQQLAMEQQQLQQKQATDAQATRPDMGLRDLLSDAVKNAKGTPLFGPMFLKLMQEMGWDQDPRMAAAINATNMEIARLTAGELNSQDETALGAPVQAGGSGAPVPAVPGGPAAGVSPGPGAAAAGLSPAVPAPGNPALLTSPFGSTQQ